jgi:hypothetical protein
MTSCNHDVVSANSTHYSSEEWQHLVLVTTWTVRGALQGCLPAKRLGDQREPAREIVAWPAVEAHAEPGADAFARG